MSNLIETYRICVPVKAEDVRSAIEMAAEAEELMVDFVEVRMDYMREFNNLSDIACLTNIPLIATFRPRRQGGLFEGRDEERIKALKEAVDAGFSYIDLELNTDGLDKAVEEFKKTGVKIIISHHEFNRTPTISELKRLLSRELSYEPYACKLITYANSLEDNLTCLTFLSRFSKSVRLICFAMGRLGLISRVLSPLYGGFFTFASLKKGLETAPGQPTVEELRRIIKVMEVVGFEDKR
ncbi:type I 3-dehydroquinate dehydratase [Candidatus Bathyarchaeota archaeon]|nr:type I 3-dehydroquinate dehydratase [Candidatus Bathyarchaeota archaeon]